MQPYLVVFLRSSIATNFGKFNKKMRLNLDILDFTQNILYGKRITLGQIKNDNINRIITITGDFLVIISNWE